MKCHMCGCDAGTDYKSHGAFRMCASCAGEHNKESVNVEEVKVEEQKEFGFEIVVEGATLPKRATKGSAAYDICANEDLIIRAGEQALVKTGITAFIPQHAYVALHSRSGLALKHRIALGNNVGIIDADYYPREICVLLENKNDIGFVVNKGERIAQAIVSPYFTFVEEEVTTERDGGFGSTGE